MTQAHQEHAATPVANNPQESLPQPSAPEVRCDGVKFFTERGFARIDFKDANGNECSIQESSASGKLWLGISKVDSQIEIPGQGFVKYDLPEKIFIPTRMHLNKEQAKFLIEFLTAFVETGDI